MTTLKLWLSTIAIPSQVLVRSPFSRSSMLCPGPFMLVFISTREATVRKVVILRVDGRNPAVLHLSGIDH